MSLPFSLAAAGNPKVAPPATSLPLAKRPCKAAPVIWKTWTEETVSPNSRTHISALPPEIMTKIFGELDVASRARAARVSSAWHDMAYTRSVWKGVEAKVSFTSRDAAHTVLRSIRRRGIKRLLVLSIEKANKSVLQDLFGLVPCLESLSFEGCNTLSNRDISSLTRNILFPAATSTAPSKHKYAQNLKHINLSLCKHINDDSILKMVRSIPRLESLNLSGCTGLTNETLAHVATHCGHLKSLNIRSTNVTDAGIVRLCGGEDIVEAAVAAAGDESISLERPAPVSGGRHVTQTLEELSLQDCQKVSDEGFRSIASTLQVLKRINLSLCQISDLGLKSFALLGSSLEEINLRSCDAITDAGLTLLCDARMPALTSLDISFCNKITDTGLSAVAAGMTRLTDLSLNSNSNITDESLVKLSKSLLQLRCLTLGQCTQITDESLHSIARHCHNLHKIDLYGCSKITPDGIRKIVLASSNNISTNLHLREETGSKKETAPKDALLPSEPQVANNEDAFVQNYHPIGSLSPAMRVLNMNFLWDHKQQQQEEAIKSYMSSTSAMRRLLGLSVEESSSTASAQRSHVAMQQHHYAMYHSYRSHHFQTHQHLHAFAPPNLDSAMSHFYAFPPMPALPAPPPSLANIHSALFASLFRSAFQSNFNF